MFNKHIKDFNENIIGLRDFIDLIDPYLTDKLEEHDKHIYPLITLGILKEMLTNKTEWEENEKEKGKRNQRQIDSSLSITQNCKIKKKRRNIFFLQTNKMRPI